MTRHSVSGAALLLGWILAGVTGCGTTHPRMETRPPAEPIVTNSIGMKLVHIESGEFLMGSPAEERWREQDEVQHPVRLTKDFYIGQTEVTRGQFAQFVNETHYRTDAERAEDVRTWRSPGIAQTDDHPVVVVTWNDARAYCEWLGRKERRVYRLPTEAEWEYACRAGTATPFNVGATASTDQANYNGNTAYPGGQKGVNRAGTVAVATFSPNAWGLHDMIGNAFEWCGDRYSRYPTTGLTDPKGGTSGNVYLTRGGSWANAPEYCRSAYRFSGRSDQRFAAVGFRCVMER